jgi:type II secretory pathway pseudopilin PulG
MHPATPKSSASDREPLARSRKAGFTLGEVCVSVAITAILCGGVFAANARLLSSLKNQKETTAVSMMLQERMEQFRSTSYSNVADKDYVKNNILTFNPAASPSPSPTPPAGGKFTTYSEPPLGSLKETVTVSGYMAAPSPSPAINAATDYNQWTRDMSTGDHQPHEQNHDDNLATQYDLIKVDIQVSWISSNGRTRNRELSAVFGKGNIGP